MAPAASSAGETFPRGPAPGTPPRAAAALAQGSMVDHFEVIRLLGRGGMGDVYAARDTKLGRKVALKLIAPELIGTGDAAARFLEEARTTARFNHPHIVAIHAVGEHNGAPYVALEHLDGQTLAERAAERRPGLQEVLRIGLAVAEALGEAHRHGVLHCDLKPENVVIPSDGRVRVIDFGVATTLADEASSPHWGTPAYMAPEQWLANPRSGATDVWALGVILFELCTGRHPFDPLQNSLSATVTAPAAETVRSPPESAPAPALIAGDPLARTRAAVAAVCGPERAHRMEDFADVPAELSALVAQCLDKDPERRPAADAIADALRALLPGGRRRLVSEESPFRGLLPFTEQYADLFFGRDAEVAAFLERARVQPILPVIGPSGAGKSSFVLAGVIPRLLEQGQWTVLKLRPGTRPFDALAGRLLRKDTGPSGAAAPGDAAERGIAAGAASRSTLTELARQLEASPHRLSLELRAIAGASGRVLLFVDQLEEIVTLTGEEPVRRAFMAALCAAADDAADPIRVVFTARDDFLGRLTTGPEVSDALLHMTVLRRLSEEELGEALRRPVETAGYAYDDPELVGRMVASVAGEPACLPLLQFAAQQLWDQRDRDKRLLLRAAYDGMGGVEGALAKHADGVLAGASPAELRVAKELLLRLVTAERTRKIERRAQALEGLGDAGKSVLARLTRARLVSVVMRREQGSVEAMLELAHESLIRTWSTLSRWIDESREVTSVLAEAAQAAALWERRGQRPDELWQGDALREALRALERLGTRSPPAVERFLTASRTREARRVARRRWLVAGAIGFLVAIAVVLSAQRIEADRMRALAEAQRTEAQRKRADAQREGALSALLSGDVIEARAKLRVALELADSSTARTLWWQLSRDTRAWRKELGAQVTTVTFTPDGRTIVAASTDEVVHLLDAITGAARLLRGHRDTITGLDVSPDGTTLATSSLDGELRLWDARSGAALPGGVLTGQGMLYTLAFSPDGAVLAAGAGDGRVRLLDARTGAEKAALTGHTGAVRALAWSPDGRTLASGSGDGSVRLWDPVSRIATRVIQDLPQGVASLSMSPGGRLLAAGMGQGSIQLLRLPSGEVERALLGHTGRVNGVRFSPDGKRIVSGSHDGTVRVWDAETGAVRRVLTGHTGTVWSVGVSPDGKTLVSGGRDRTVRVARIEGRGDREGARGHTGPVNGVRFSPDGKRIGSVSHDGTVRLWDVRTGEVTRVLSGHTGSVQGISFQPGGALLASSGRDKSVRLWSLLTGAEERALLGHADTVVRVAFSPDGLLLATAANDGSVRLWDPLGETPPKVLPATDAWDVAVSPDGRLLALALDDGRVALRALPGGEPKKTFVGHTEAVLTVDFSQDGRALASGGDDQEIRVWDVATGLGSVVAKAPWRVHAVAFHPDGRRLGAAGSGRVARIYDLDSGRSEALRGHRDEVSSMDMSPDGALAVTGSDDRTVRVWDVENARPYWRAPALLGGPPRLLSHLGWSTPGGGALDPFPRSRVTLAIEERARFASEARQGGTAGWLCIERYDGAVELWDAAADDLRATRPATADEPDSAKSVQEALAVPGGCAVRTSGSVELLSADGAVHSLPLEGAPGALALVRDPDELLVATDRAVFRFDVTGALLSRTPTPASATAITRSGGSLFAGYRDGLIEQVAAGEGRAASAAVPFEKVPSSAPVHLLAGPMGTLIAGYSNGELGMWNQGDGARLAHASLHGAVIHLLLEDRKLYAATDLGDSIQWDLGALYRDYCDLLTEVWAEVPVIWEAGRPVVQDPPRDHRCR